MEDKKLYFMASDVSINEQKSNDVFLLVEMRICSTQPNGNGEGVTLAFIDEVVASPEKYNCLPLYADIDRLLRGDWQSLGHMFNRETGEFGTTQVGSITEFRKEEDEYGTSLIGEARIPKREADVCECVMRLFEMGKLNFSFEIRYVKDATVEKDGVCYVDANENNALTGVAIVSVPAYKESVALNLVAEQVETEAEGVETEMTLEEAMAALAQKDEEIAAKDQIIAERDAKIAEMEASAAVAEKETEVEEAVSECEEPVEKEEATAENEEQKDEVVAECEEKDEAVAEDIPANEEKEACAEVVDEKMAQMEAELNELRAAKAELDAIKAEMAAKEKVAAQATAKSFAEQQGLDCEDEKVMKAIAELDYKAIAEMSMEIAAAKTETVVASLVVDGFNMKGGKYDDILAPAE